MRIFLIITLLLITMVFCGCGQSGDSSSWSLDERFSALRDAYFLQFLQFNPVVSTYLGGDGYSRELKTINGRLRDFSSDAMALELSYYRNVKNELANIQADSLSQIHQVDYLVMNSQLNFLIREIGELKLHEKAIEAYVLEAVNGVMYQLQQLENLGGGLQGTEEEWDLIVQRVKAIPPYLQNARNNLRTGIDHGRLPDWRKIERDGFDGSLAAIAFFENDLPAYADTFLGDRGFAGRIKNELAEASTPAVQAYNDFMDFLRDNFDLEDKTDRFAIGEAEYRTRIRSNFGITASLNDLYEYGWQQVVSFQEKMFVQAELISIKYGLGLDFSTDGQKRASTREIMRFLQKDAPANDAALLDLYRDTTSDAVDYGREHDLFEIPAEYKIDIIETPPVLQSSISAAYVPAPPYKKGAVGQFMVSPTGNDPAKLAENNPSAITAVAVHEGFAGHDWHYQFMSEHVADISSIRWLPVGSVQDELSMWSDSMGAEGWAHYSEELLSEAAVGNPLGFYTDETYLSYLEQALLRAARVRVDIGIHTGKMTYDQGVDFFCEHVHFYPDARRKIDEDDEARAIFDSSDREIFRYTKWPTQAITYNLGKKALLDLRAWSRAQPGNEYSDREFHEKIMKQGTISPYFYNDQVFPGSVLD